MKHYSKTKNFPQGDLLSAYLTIMMQHMYTGVREIQAQVTEARQHTAYSGQIKGVWDKQEVIRLRKTVQAIFQSLFKYQPTFVLLN